MTENKEYKNVPQYQEEDEMEIDLMEYARKLWAARKLLFKVAGIAVIVGVVGALLLGVGMCLCMVFSKMLLGVIIGLVGIVVLLMLIPLTRGIHD